METRKDEIRFTTKDVRQAIDNYISKDVKKTWTEDFVDESTGKTVSIERNAVIYTSGTLVTPDLASKLQFDLEAGEITEIEVSNQCRLGHKYENFCPWKVTVVAEGSKKSYLLQAAGMVKAIEVIDDWMELNHIGLYTIFKVENMSKVLIVDSLKRSTPDEGNKDFIDEDNAKDAENPKENGYYIVEAVIRYLSKDDDSETHKDVRKAIILADAADIASDIAIAYFKMEERGDEYESCKVEVIAKSAAPFPLNSIIPKEFYEAYIPKRDDA